MQVGQDAPMKNQAIDSVRKNQEQSTFKAKRRSKNERKLLLSNTLDINPYRSVQINLENNKRKTKYNGSIDETEKTVSETRKVGHISERPETSTTERDKFTPQYPPDPKSQMS